MNILHILTSRRITGNIGENLAVKYLKKHGYKILKRNYVALDSEIDVIAKNRDTICFVEVKARTVDKDGALDTRPAAAVNIEKQKKIIKCAKWYLGSIQFNQKLQGLKSRLDIVEVYLKNGRNDKKELEKIIHIEGAFRIENELHQHKKLKRTRRK